MRGQIRTILKFCDIYISIYIANNKVYKNHREGIVEVEILARLKRALRQAGTPEIHVVTTLYSMLISSLLHKSYVSVSLFSFIGNYAHDHCCSWSILILRCLFSIWRPKNQPRWKTVEASPSSIYFTPVICTFYIIQKEQEDQSKIGLKVWPLSQFLLL